MEEMCAMKRALFCALICGWTCVAQLTPRQVAQWQQVAISLGDKQATERHPGATRVRAEFETRYNEFVAAMNACNELIASGKTDRGKHNPCKAERLVGMLDKLTRHKAWPR